MSHFILIRHSNPETKTDRPAKVWRLSDLGKERAFGLSPILARYDPAKLFSSDEPKAIETSTIIAEALNIPCRTLAGLYEHKRSQEGWTSKEHFESQIAELFTKPDQLVFGEETAYQARSRFNNAIGDLLLDHPDETIAVVSHGTVMTLFVSYWNDVDPFQIWHSLEMPSMVVMSRQSFELEAILSVDNN